MEEEHEGGQDVTSWRERKQNNRMVSVSLVSVKFDSEKAKFRGCTVVSESVKIFSFFASPSIKLQGQSACCKRDRTGYG